jgi:hypothetical protein
MEMARFKGSDDAGYIQVRDQLWAWIQEMPSQHVEPVVNNNQNNHNHDLESTAGTSSTRSPNPSADRIGSLPQNRGESQVIYSGSVNSGGGPSRQPVHQWRLDSRLQKRLLIV